MQVGAGSAETRKTVTVLFCDLVGSTALGESADPEVLRRILTRYFETVSAAIERHGGSVEKFIGDAVMAAFGMPAVREDDALRAVRAAFDLRADVEALGAELAERLDVRLEVRVGVHTGEVVAADDPSGKTLFGDAVNTAARLEQAAGAGEILLGDVTHRLVAGAVEAEAVGDVEARGKSRPVPAWRLLGLVEGAEAVARRFDVPFVGREPELAVLRSAFAEAVAEGLPRLVTVLGEAGIGKTRLVAELSAELRAAAAVLTGRCPSYGDGLTFWPLRELVESAGIDELDLLDARERSTLAGAIGAGGEPGRTDEVFPAVRRLVEALAARGPLCLVLEDLHWAEPTFLDLLEYLVGLVSGPVLLVGIARPDLLDERAGWGADGASTSTVRLPPLSPADSELLAGSLGDLPPEARADVLAASEGNPLFLEQLTVAAAETKERGGLPATIQALLDARLERLDPDERAVLDRAAVLSLDFDEELLAPLLPAESRGQLSRRLVSLTRRQLLEIERAAARPYRFHHALIQEAAYRSVPKTLRAELHEQVAAIIASAADPALAAGLDALAGHHLASAHRYRVELGETGEDVTSLGRRAAERLARAGRQAVARADMRAAATLLEHAIELDDDPVRGCELRLDAAVALVEPGLYEEADEHLAEALALAEREQQPALQWRARVARAGLALGRNLMDAETAMAVGEAGFEIAREAGDDLGAVRAAQLVANVFWLQGRLVAMAETAQRALPFAQAISSDSDEANLRVSLIAGRFFDLETPLGDHRDDLEEAIAWARARGNRFLEALMVGARAHDLAQRGEFDEGRVHRDRSVELFRELGAEIWAVNHPAGLELELLAGDEAAAEAVLRHAMTVNERAGNDGQLAWTAACLADLLLDQGRIEEAEAFLERSAEVSGADDIAQRVVLPAIRARLLVAQGRPEEAEPLARESLAIAERTEMAELHVRARESLAGVLTALGRKDEAAVLLEAVVAIWERKGFLVRARQAREQLERLGG